MIIKINSRIPINDTDDIIIRATPKDAPEDDQKTFFIVEKISYDPDRSHFQKTTHCLDMNELRSILNLKKRERVAVIE